MSKHGRPRPRIPANARNMAIGDWLVRYSYEINRQLAKCTAKNHPRGNQLPAGHMYYADKLSPKVAAKRYLASSRYGKLACARKRSR